MISLYEQNPENWDKLADFGKPHLREVAKHFQRAADMDKALGVLGAACHWHAGRNMASSGSEAMAKAWLDKNNKIDEAPKKSGARMLLVVASADVAAKVEKIAAMLGAEVTDV